MLKLKRKILTGIDQLALNKVRLDLKAKQSRIAILCHPASVSQQGKHLAEIIESKYQLYSSFGPQHGIHGETQDNMIEWQDTRDGKGRAVYSLYGERRKPSLESLKNTDAVVIDLFDVGSRYYTFIYTISYMLEVCGELQIPVFVLDRPNPLGGQIIEGPILDLEYQSFVGLYELPVRHGMTVGELANFFNAKLKKKAPLEIIKMKGFKRRQFFPETGLAWTLPSPNMPNFEAALFYPGGCLIEGTSLSEGRGTTRPFELIGAPFLDWTAIEIEYRKLAKENKIGGDILFHRQGFIPTFHKFKGEVCKGALQICRNPKTFQPLRHQVTLFWILRQLYGQAWQWTLPPYEYEFTKLPIDILCGGPEIRECIDQGSPLKKLFMTWKKDEERFKRIRQTFLLYR